MNQKFLNIGCDKFKLNGFINIDLNPDVNPDLCIDLKNLNDHFPDNSVDFIFAGHVLEHLEKEDSQNLMRCCYKILKRFGTLLAVVPDFQKAQKEDIEYAEKIVLAGGDHKMIFNSERLGKMLKNAGFYIAQEVIDLNQVPYLLVPNINDPKPEPWQTAYLALKVY
jgi:predicted SAM-dependent methyltransferase